MNEEELRTAFQVELPRLLPKIDYFFVSTSVAEQWHAHLHTCSRRFELGSTVHGGFYCREETAGSFVSFVPVDSRPTFPSVELMVRCGLGMIRTALDNPLQGEPEPPTI